MGIAKSEWMEAQDRGWSEIEDKFVCDQCVDDQFLKMQVRAAVAAKQCDYCQRTSEAPIAAPVRVVQEHVAETVSYYYAEQAESGCPYDQGWIIEPTDIDDVLLSIDLECKDDLFADIKDAFINTDWIPAANGHWSSLHPNDALRYSWERFSRWVQHETRFFFSQVQDSADDYEPHEIDGRSVLPVIGELAAELGLISILPQNQIFYRARKRPIDASWIPNAETMGAPPSELSRAGRMNPAGISYLYLALEEPTAMKEIAGESTSNVVVAEFEAQRELRVLDLSRLPEKPSLFDAERREQREGLIFLDHFVKEISKPIAKDGYEHVNYVPSQVVSEFFALVFRDGGIAIDGIAYPSAVNTGGRNLVLFPTKRGVNRLFGAVNFNRAYTKTADATSN